jgi:putative transposase
MTQSDSKALRKKPALLYISKGATVSHNGRDYVVLRVVDLNLVLALDPASQEKVLLKIGAIEPAAQFQQQVQDRGEAELEEVPDEDWEVAEGKLNIIEPLLNAPGGRPKADYVAAAHSAGVGIATLYRWIAAYRNSGLLSALLPIRRPGGAKKSRLNPEVQLIVDDYIRTKHLTLQKPSIAKSTKEIRRLCSNAGLTPAPAATTIQRQIEWISGEIRLKRREGAKAAREKFAVHKGSIPDAEWPLAMVQIDHTLLPVMIVDDKHRKPINRPWITLAIDVNSRVCLGMYLSLDPPSSMSAGMCMSHAILPKETWMARLGCADIEWPFYGVPDVLHMDNAREFRGNMLRVAANEYHIDLHLRPVKVPHYGAHIERLMGTVSEDLKSVAGATFSGPDEKGEYDAEGNACATFDELEQWLVIFFARYHRDIHRGIGTIPLAKWREGILGTKGKPGRGLPPRRNDTEKVRIDFMPFEERTVQDYGVVNDKVHYFHDVLRPWMNAPHPKNPRQKRKFRFRYDPRDISQLYFFDPDLKRYFAIPYRDSSLTPVSMWELRAAQKAAIKLGMDQYNERDVFELINRQREIEEKAAEKTKAARHEQQRRVQHTKSRTTTQEELPTVSSPTPSTTTPTLRGYNPNKIRPLDDDE